MFSAWTSVVLCRQQAQGLVDTFLRQRDVAGGLNELLAIGQHPLVEVTDGGAWFALGDKIENAGRGRDTCPRPQPP